MAQKTTRNARLEARISPDALAVAEVEVIRLSREGQEKFAALILKPQPLHPVLRKALKTHRSRVVY